MNDEDQISCKKISDAVAAYCPPGSIIPGGGCDIDARSVRKRAGIELELLQRLARSRRLAKLLGVDRVSYCKPTDKRNIWDEGIVRLVRREQSR